MVRSEIISKLSDKIHHKLKKSELDQILEVIIQTIIEGTKNNRSIELRNFGRFSPKIIKARNNARNPKTQEIIETIEKKSISFKMSNDLKNEINNSEREKN